MNPISNNQFLAAVLEEAARKEISSMDGWSMDMLEKYHDKVNWKEIIDSWDIKHPILFFKRYENHIPMSQFQNSRLWDKMVEIIATQLKVEILGLR